MSLDLADVQVGDVVTVRWPAKYGRQTVTLRVSTNNELALCGWKIGTKTGRELHHRTIISSVSARECEITKWTKAR